MIIVDDRERPSGICDALTALNERHEVRRLDVGDYVVNGKVFVERKTAADFLESIADRRIFKQAARLRHGNRWSVLIVEGGSLPGGASVRGVLCSLAVEWYLPVLRSSNLAGTAWLLACIRKHHEQSAQPMHLFDYRDKRGIASLEARMLTQLRNVGPEIAKTLLGHFGSLGRIIDATKDELMAVPGVGEFIAGQVATLKGEDKR